MRRWAWIVVVGGVLSGAASALGVPTPDPYDPRISDDYSKIAHVEFSSQWGSYNLHDPTILKDDATYYIFSTDVMYGPLARNGIMRRKSRDLVHWDFLGWVFPGVPDEAARYVREASGGTQPAGVWAPYALKVGKEHRLYYSVSGVGANKSCIGLATGASPRGPWKDAGIVLSTGQGDIVNAIDPAAIMDAENGRHWMCYGSYFAGIYIVQLNRETGKTLVAGDKGRLIARRAGDLNAIEGAEILYNPELRAYFLFVSYDALIDAYNVRVGRSAKPEGPYLDFDGKDMQAASDNLPMITAQYRFKNHPGWQGVGHCGLLRDGKDFFFVSQGRLGSNKHLMDLHVRRMAWTPSGWPAVSPERYAGLPWAVPAASDLAGKWEHIDLTKTESKNESVEIEFLADGIVSGVPDSAWSVQGRALRLSFRGGQRVYDAIVLPEWDWENKKRTWVYTGLCQLGMSGWGKKVGHGGTR